MLENLHEIAEKCKKHYLEEFNSSEIVLSTQFRDVYGAYLRKQGQTINFTDHTAVVITNGNLKIFISNQWFYASSFMVPYVKQLVLYKRLWEQIVLDDYPDVNSRKEFAEKLKNGNQISITEYEKQIDKKRYLLFPKEGDFEIVKSYLLKFATDYKWWNGSKTINRGDFYVSPCLSLLGLVNNSQGFIADICYAMATDIEVSSELETMIEKYEKAGTSGKVKLQSSERLVGGVNLIVYGAPGTGKSRYLDDIYGASTDVSRIIFHPEYSFSDFVGCYKPVPVYRKNDNTLQTISGVDTGRGEPFIDYAFVPGPFIQVLINAWLHPDKMFTLIIEEINRANTAAVFGDIFQLLDRNIDGQSEYSIEPPYDLKSYLFSIDGMAQYITEGLRIPSNMNIVATMNSADQGVMPMDSAFKRRWNFVYRKIDISGAVHADAPVSYGGTVVSWGWLVRAINNKLLSMNYQEDRLIGPYFIRPEELGKKSAWDKLLLYLWDDVLRYDRDAFFNSLITTFQMLSESFQSIDVFNILENNFLPASSEEDESPEDEDQDEESA